VERRVYRNGKQDNVINRGIGGIGGIWGIVRDIQDI
jgi:hypothetical protein